MKYFTHEWWGWASEDVNQEKILAVFNRYDRYLARIRPRLSPSIRSLVDDISLHDSEVQQLTIDLAGETATLILYGYVDPWKPETSHLKRSFDLHYEGVSSVTIADEETRAAACLDQQDLGYHEIELLKGNRIEHRMLFASGTELKIVFQKLRLKYKRLPSLRH